MLHRCGLHFGDPFWQASVSECPVATCVRPTRRVEIGEALNHVADGDEDADDEGEEIHHESGIRHPVHVKQPNTPTPEEVAEHEASHLFFRSQ